MDLSGHYQLDREHSDSLFTHMQALGCDEIAALASEKLEIEVDIVQTPDQLIMYQTSQLGGSKRILSLIPGKETIESDTRRAKVVMGPKTVVIETHFSKGRLVDSRHFEKDGHVLAQVLELMVSDNPHAIIRTRRYLNKTGAPNLGIVDM